MMSFRLGARLVLPFMAFAALTGCASSASDHEAPAAEELALVGRTLDFDLDLELPRQVGGEGVDCTLQPTSGIATARQGSYRIADEKHESVTTDTCALPRADSDAEECRSDHFVVTTLSLEATIAGAVSSAIVLECKRVASSGWSAKMLDALARVDVHAR